MLFGAAPFSTQNCTHTCMSLPTSIVHMLPRWSWERLNVSRMVYRKDFEQSTGFIMIVLHFLEMSLALWCCCMFQSNHPNKHCHWSHHIHVHVVKGWEVYMYMHTYICMCLQMGTLLRLCTCWCLAALKVTISTRSLEIKLYVPSVIFRGNTLFVIF